MSVDSQTPHHTFGGYTVPVTTPLHCLNFIWQEFNPERYHNSPHAHAHANVDPTLHRDHCIEAIRQSLMCDADLAPIPSR